MEKTKKTPIDEAKASYEEIRNYAKEAAKKDLEKEINEKVDKILKESLNVDVDDENNITIIKDDKTVEVDKSGNIEIKSSQTEDSISNIDTNIEIGDENIENEFEDDNEEIQIDMQEELYEQEQVQQTQTQPEVQQKPNLTDTQPQQEPSDQPDEEISLDDDINMEDNTDVEVSNDVMMLAKSIVGIIDKAIDQKMEDIPSGEQGADIQYIDDEQSAEVQPQPEPQPQPEIQPIQEEDELLEISLEELEGLSDEEIEIDDDVFSDDELLEIEIPDKNDGFFDFSKNDNNNETLEFDEDELEEVLMQGQSHTAQRSQGRSAGPEMAVKNRGRKNNSDDVPYQRINESVNKIKVQYESMIDELKKENKSLNESNREFRETIKSYKNSFVDLRKQFDEMQNFNAKLAYVNKIFANGGLSTQEKMKIMEEFDKVKNSDEAKNLYSKIIQENKIVINKSNASKINQPSTKSVKPKEVIFESDEIKRRKILAGIDKNEDYI